MAGNDDADALLKNIMQFFTGKGDAVVYHLPTSLQDEEYNMKHAKRGLCVIFNQKVFIERLGLKERTGTDIDAENLEEHFSRLDFSVETHNDFTVTDIKTTVKSLSEKDHTEHDCFVCCMLSHGEDGCVYGTDGKLALSEILDPFLGKECPSLVGKPKIFIIQACRGDRVDKGLVVKDTTDAHALCKMPSSADVLIYYSTIQGYMSWRNEGFGSWFVHALCKVLDEESYKTDFLNMLTTVNRYVAFCYESYNHENREQCGMKQMPCVEHTLTRRISFVPKETTV